MGSMLLKQLKEYHQSITSPYDFDATFLLTLRKNKKSVWNPIQPRSIYIQQYD
jgi:hypothetical protein